MCLLSNVAKYVREMYIQWMFPVHVLRCVSELIFLQMNIVTRTSDALK